MAYIQNLYRDFVRTDGSAPAFLDVNRDAHMVLNAGPLASMRIYASDYNRLGSSQSLGITVGDGVTLSTTGVMNGTTVSVNNVKIGTVTSLGRNEFTITFDTDPTVTTSARLDALLHAL